MIFGKISHWSPLATVMLLAFALYGCGSSSDNARTPLIQACAQSNAGLESTLAELDAMQVPEGARPEVFALLKSALRDALIKAGAGRAVSEPPIGEGNRVNDLSLIHEGGVSYSISWHYRNLGDYDQGGAVGIADITPIAMHFGETYEPTDPNCVAAVVDGSGNLVVDISDITPLAINFGVDCAEYLIEQSDNMESGWEEVARVELGDATGEGRLEFVYSGYVPSAGMQYLRVTPFDAEGAPGIASEPVEIPGGAPVISGVSPEIGLVAEDVQFIVDVAGSLPFTFAWDFGGGAMPNTSNLAEPEVTLGAEGDYMASLTVTNSLGNETYPFTLRVGYAPDITSVDPEFAAEQTDVGFFAGVTGTGPLAYVWDFGEGFDPVASDEVSPTITVPEAGEYQCSLTVASDFGSDEYPFTVFTGEPATIMGVAIPTPEECESGASLIFSVDAIGTPPITYAWDFAGGADPNTSDETDPMVTLGAPGDYGMSVTVTNSFGDDTFPFDVHVIGWRVTPVVEDTDIGYTSLAIVDGRPAIGYYPSWIANPYYVSASDTLGESWNTPVVIDTAFPSGNYCSLAEVGGYPAMTYYDQSPGNLNYVRANDANGATWGTPQVLDTGG